KSSTGRRAWSRPPGAGRRGRTGALPTRHNTTAGHMRCRKGMAMDWQTSLKTQWQLSTDRFLKAIEDVTPEEAAARPQDLTPITWRLAGTLRRDPNPPQHHGRPHALQKGDGHGLADLTQDPVAVEHRPVS